MTESTPAIVPAMLQPCPWCGSKAKLIEGFETDNSRRMDFRVICEGRDCLLDVNEWWRFPSTAIDKWNQLSSPVIDLLKSQLAEAQAKNERYERLILLELCNNGACVTTPHSKEICTEARAIQARAILASRAEGEKR